VAYLDYSKAQQDLNNKTLEGIRAAFPMVGGLQSLELEDLHVPDTNTLADDVQGQHQAKVEGRSWSVPVTGTIVLKSNDGKVVDKQQIRLADIPVITRRHSYIMGGQEWQVDNQWQLMPGVYTRRRANGKLESHFNTPVTRNVRVTFDPESKEFVMSRGKTERIPIYHLLRTLGVDDDSLEKVWGKDILQANKGASHASTALERFYRADRRTAPPNQEEAAKYFVQKMGEVQLRPEVTAKTLGKAATSVDGDTFLRATKRMLDVQAGAPEDDRDSLEFKVLRSTGDYIQDFYNNSVNKRSIRKRVMGKLSRATSVREVLKYDMFNRPIQQAFSRNAAARQADQINPVEMLASASQTTSMGSGGIQSDEELKTMVGLKLVNPSHLGFLDPVRTPENDKTGVTLRMPLGVTKVGDEPRITLFNVKSNKYELVNPRVFADSVVAMPDQVEWKRGKPSFLGKTVKASAKGNELTDVPANSVQYIARHPSQFFNVTTNLIPFLSTVSGNRATYADQHIEQSISLKRREAPLVQVATGSEDDSSKSWEQVIGRNTSHVALKGGKVTAVTPNYIEVRAADGSVSKVSLYNHYPLNDKKSMLHSTPTVKVGDAVAAGQHIADTNFTQKGELALGTNLRVAYIPYKGYNFEDGVVISRSAAERLASEHLHKPTTQLSPDAITAPSKFQMHHPEAYTKTQYSKLDEGGVVRVGQKVDPGDPLVLAANPYRFKNRLEGNAMRKVLLGVHTNSSLTWDGDQPGEVVDVYRGKKGEVRVHVKSVEPMQVADKLAGRYGNKGVVTLIVDDDKMPRTADGKPIDVALNPSGVPGRMNTGQVLETAASKIARKTGKPYVVDSFERQSLVEKVKSDLKKHGLTDQEELFDPETGLKMGKALVGEQHILKLVHQVDKKTAARSGMGGEGEGYEQSTLLPSQGGKSGGQSMGPYGLVTLLTHGAKANIREMQTFKSEGPRELLEPSRPYPSQHINAWTAIVEGRPLPVPKPTFSYRKFEDMLRGAGINLEKKGNEIQLTPLTDKQVLEMSSGKLVHPGDHTYSKVDPNTGTLKPKPGGLFDPRLTGGLGGKKWTHIELPEPVVNPVFEVPVRKLLGLTEEDYRGVATGERAWKDGKFVPLDTEGSVTGGLAFRKMLEGIDVEKDLAQHEKALAAMTVPEQQYTAKGKKKGNPPAMDALIKKVKYLRALKETGLKPVEAYTLQNIPVMPPIMRTPSLLPDGSAKWEDVNRLYSDLGSMVAENPPSLLDQLTDQRKKDFRASMYDAVAAIQGVHTPSKDPRSVVGGSMPQGLLAQIAGSTATSSSPKKGYLQKVLLNRKQDLTMRSVIVPEPALGLDEVGLPHEQALTMYKPFVVEKLVANGAAPTALSARELVDKKTPAVWRALESVFKERPVLLKRDPALHAHSVQAFTPRLAPGKAIQIHPLVTGGFNADFDGDAMSAYVPISREAVEEAQRMRPSNNLYNVASGGVMYTPTLESALGLYKLSRIDGEKKGSYKTPGDALEAVKAGKLTVNNLTTIGGVRTTPGRVLLAAAVPEPLRNGILTKHDQVIDKGGITKLFERLAKNHRDEFAVTADRLKDLGNGAASGAVAVVKRGDNSPEVIAAAERAKETRHFIPVPVHSLGLDDFTPDVAVRQKHLDKAQAMVKAVEKTTLSRKEKDARTIEAWTEASEGMTKEHLEKMKTKPTNLAIMLHAGVKPSVDQYRQMVLAPMVLNDGAGNPVKTPVTSSYSEGLDVAGYWTQMHGARAGSIKKVQEVEEPGYFSKGLVQAAMNMVVAGPDCGTNRGVALPLSSNVLHDRILAQPFKAKNVDLPAGTTLTPDLIDQMRLAKKHGKAVVRSTLKCEHDAGVCQKCAGLSPSGQLHEVGTNVGIQAAQSLGERSVQLTLKAFHTGGVRGGNSSLLNAFERVQQLTNLPDNIPDEMVLARTTGKVEKVEKDSTGVKVWIGGKTHHVGRDRKGNALNELLPKAAEAPGFVPWQPPKVGMRVEAGQPLSDPNRTNLNPHRLYQATGNMEKVQNFLTDELHRIYGGAKGTDMRRQHVETVVAAMGQVTKVRDPGDSELVKGIFTNAPGLRALNKTLVSQGKRPVEHSPVLKGVNMVTLDATEDWLAKMMHKNLRDTVLEAAATGGRTNLHGINPVPGMVYGAEFGYTGKDSGKPGLGHLKGVPGYHY